MPVQEQIVPFKSEPDIRPDEPKWVILYRDNSTTPWRVFSHHKTGKPYRYVSIDAANSSLRATFHKKRKDGNAKIEREDRV